MLASAEKISLSVLSADSTCADAKLRQEWAAETTRSESLNSLFASPLWFDHLARTSMEGECALVVGRDESGDLAGLCPIVVHPFVLKYDVWNRPLARTTLRAASILGGEPLLWRDAATYRQLFEGIFRGRPDCDCVYMDSVPTHSPLWIYLQGEGQATSQYVAYQPEGTRPWLCVDLKGKFQDYVKHISPSSRYKIRKHLRDLREHGGGTLECVRVDSEKQVDEFLENAAQASQESWKQRVLGARVVNSDRQKEQLRFLARQGILRSYVLRCGQNPCAFVIGYQFQNVFHYAEVGYDESLARFRPGNGLLYLLIEDLYQHDRPAMVTFGIGDAEYKRRFGNLELADAGVILFRKTLSNRLRRASHSTFYSAVRLAKKLLRREPVA